MTPEVLIAATSAALAWIGFTEKRLSSIKTDVTEAIEEKDKLFDERNQDIKMRMVRIEDKLDELIKKVYSENG